jgi:hypothetical protein
VLEYPARIVASYVVTARIEQVQPRIASRDDRRHIVARRALEVTEAEAIDLSSPVSERWDRIRELWGQTTFYLFDPESWR